MHVRVVIADLRSDYKLEIDCFAFDPSVSDRSSVNVWCEGILLRVEQLAWAGDVADVGEHRADRYRRVVEKLNLQRHGTYLQMKNAGHRINRAAIFTCKQAGA